MSLYHYLDNLRFNWLIQIVKLKSWETHHDTHIDLKMNMLNTTSFIQFVSINEDHIQLIFIV